jgi:hypothetical protein
VKCFGFADLDPSGLVEELRQIVIAQGIPHMQYTETIRDMFEQSKDTGELSLFWPILVSSVTVWTTSTMYGIGGAILFGKEGWKFVQPGVGGIRFMICLTLAGILAFTSTVIPWAIVKDFGWYPVSPEDRGKELFLTTQRDLLVVASGFGMLSNLFCLLALMSFDSRETFWTTRLENLDLGKWNWNSFGASRITWYFFLLVQFSFVFYSTHLAVVVEYSKRERHYLIQCLLLVVVYSLISIPLFITSVVGGKMIYGERRFRMWMPCQGGAMFLVLRAIGWTWFCVFLALTFMKLYRASTSFSLVSEELEKRISILTPWIGLMSYIFILASLFWFDPNKTNYSEDDVDEKHKKLRNKLKNTSTIKGILGKRLSIKTKGAMDYLVHSTTGGSSWIPAHELALTHPTLVKRYEQEEDNKRFDRSRSITSEEEDEDDYFGSSDEADDASHEVEDAWEELEDENGNVYFVNEKRNITQTSTPKMS